MAFRVSGNIEVRGTSVQCFYDGFGAFRSSASRVLLRHGLGKPGADKFAVFEADGWYPMQNYLRAMHEIVNEVGPGPVHMAGQSIPRNAVFPQSLRDIRSA